MSGRGLSAIARLVAVVAGIAGVVLCALVPLLPVKQTTATIAWPQAPGPDGMVTDITAPLVSGAPQALDISIPCQAIATLPAEGGLVLSTVPQGRQRRQPRAGCSSARPQTSSFVAFRDSVAAAAPRPAVARGQLQRAAHLGQRRAGGRRLRRHSRRHRHARAGEEAPGRRHLHRPEGGRRSRDCRRAIDVDTRFITTPTPLKLAVMVLGVLSVLASIVALGGPRQTGRAGACRRAWRRFLRVGARRRGSPTSA